MKKIFLIPFLLTMLASFSGCETQDSLDPRPVIVDGQYVRLDITNKVFALEHPETAMFGGMLTTPGNNVQRYELYVRRKNAAGIITGNNVLLLTVNSFPYELKITPQMIADVLGITVSDLQIGDFYGFSGVSYGFDGSKVEFINLSATVRSQPGMKQGYRFVTSSLTDAAIENFSDELNGLTFDNYQPL